MEYAEYKAACDTAHNSANATMKAMVEASKIYIDSPLGENWEGYLRPRRVPPIVIVLLVMGIGWLFFSRWVIKLLKGTTGKLAQSSEQGSEQTASEVDKAKEETASYGKTDMISNTVHILDEICQRKN
jgi:hypothetical protein